MLVIDVDMNRIKEISSSAKGMSVFYTEGFDRITIYTHMSGMLFRHIHRKENNENDGVWKTTNLDMGAVKVDKIGEFGGDVLENYRLNVYEMMRRIEERLEVIGKMTGD